MALERSVCDPAGLPQRGWFKHLIYAPLPSYLAETLPRIREALVAGDDGVARVEAERLTRRLAAATDAARGVAGSGDVSVSPAAATAPPPRPTPRRR